MTTSKVKSKKPLQKMTKDELIKEVNRQKKIKSKINENAREVYVSGMYEKKINSMLSESNKKATERFDDYVEAFKHIRRMEEKRIDLKILKNKQSTSLIEFGVQVISPLVGILVQEMSNIRPEPKNQCEEKKK